jgi:hypothetical protein
MVGDVGSGLSAPQLYYSCTGDCTVLGRLVAVLRTTYSTARCITTGPNTPLGNFSASNDDVAWPQGSSRGGAWFLLVWTVCMEDWRSALIKDRYFSGDV